MVQSGIPFNLQDGTDRQYKLINSYLELMVEREPVKATRKEIHISDEPILKQAQDLRSNNDSKVVFEHKVGDQQRKD